MNEFEPHEPILLTGHKKYLADKSLPLFVETLRTRYSVGTLERLAKRPENPEIRRAAVFALGCVGDFAVNPTVGCAMHDRDPVVRQLAQAASRNVWNRSGSSWQRKQLAEIVRLNADGKYRETTERATTLIGDAPWLAEAWYHRGAAWFELNHFGMAGSYFHQTLELNPYQFVAATAMGESFIRLADPASALECFKRALKLNPSLSDLNKRVVELSRQVDEE